ncbi:MAG: ABC transporter ATP-binding protein [Solobacterium sp.]|nr:ABC transporter ATP-binding protein [Solobacterium sp.]
MSDIVLELKDVSHVYNSGENNAVKAVDHVSFTVKRGETFGLVGESGCGKTTTGKMIVKLIEATEGTILFEGQDISGIRKKDRLEFHRKVQMIFQDPYASLDPRMTVKDIIGEGLRTHHLVKNEKELEERTAELLETVGMQKDHASRYPHEFSGGQRQRIGIARALAVNPEFIICDEPISALDVSIQAQIVNMLKNLQKQFGYTYLFIAHDLAMVKYISDRIGVMCRGKLVEIGDADSVYFNPVHPYTKNLVSAIPLPDPRTEKERIRSVYIQPQESGSAEWREAEPGHFVYL